MNLCLTCRVTHKTQKSDKGQVWNPANLPLDLLLDTIINEKFFRNYHGNISTLLFKVTGTK